MAPGFIKFQPYVSLRKCIIFFPAINDVVYAIHLPVFTVLATVSRGICQVKRKIRFF
jgi:hypothetical protein